VDNGGLSVIDRTLLIFLAIVFYILIRFLQQTQDDLSMLARTMDERVARCEAAILRLETMELKR
jgi:hypothetical protein